MEFFCVAKANVVASPLLAIEEWIELNLMTYDIWHHSIVALTHARCGWEVSDLLHFLSMPQL
jgi:hypothetical protein